MKLPSTWLSSFLDQALKRALSRAPVAENRRERALTLHMGRSGLLFGAPLPDHDGSGLADELGLMLPLLRYLNQLSQAAVLIGPPRDRRATKAALLDVLAAVYADEGVAEALAAGPEARGYRRGIGRLASALRGHRYLAGNPLVGLTLHHAFIAADAVCVLDLLRLDPGDTAGRNARLEARDAEHDALVSGIGRLTLLRDDVEPEQVTGAVVWHMKHLGLGRARAARFVELARAGGAPTQVASLVPDGAELRTLLAVMMVARVDGRVSEEERAWLAALGHLLRIDTALWDRMLRRVDRFCSEHRADLDPLTYAMAFEVEGSPVPAKLVRSLRDNAQGVWTEIRETGDLAVLLAKRSSGQQLSADETKRMRDQLLDVARVIPGLAVFGLPGGMFLLPVLMRLLPFDLRPSAFRPGAFRAFDDPDGSLYRSMEGDALLTEEGASIHEQPSG